MRRPQSPRPLDDLPHVREALRAREAQRCFLAVDGRAERDAEVVIRAEVRAALQVQRVEVARQEAQRQQEPREAETEE